LGGECNKEKKALGQGTDTERQSIAVQKKKIGEGYKEELTPHTKKKSEGCFTQGNKKQSLKRCRMRVKLQNQRV